MFSAIDFIKITNQRNYILAGGPSLGIPQFTKTADTDPSWNSTGVIELFKKHLLGLAKNNSLVHVNPRQIGSAMQASKQLSGIMESKFS